MSCSMTTPNLSIIRGSAMSCSMATSIIRGMLSCSMITPNLSIIEAVLCLVL